MTTTATRTAGAHSAPAPAAEFADIRSRAPKHDHPQHKLCVYCANVRMHDFQCKVPEGEPCKVYTCKRHPRNHSNEGRTEMTTIKAGRYTTNRTRDWWDDPRLSDTARAWAVAAALELPEDVVEIVADSDEEVDLASVWLVTDDHEKAIGHVTTDPDGTIVVEVLDDVETDNTVVDLKTAEDHIRAGHQVTAYWTIEQAADTHLTDDGRLIVSPVIDTVAHSQSETGFWCATCETETEPGPDTEIEYA